MPAFAQAVPPGFGRLRDDHFGGEQEGSVAVYSTTDSASGDALIKDFRAALSQGPDQVITTQLHRGL